MRQLITVKIRSWSRTCRLHWRALKKHPCCSLRRLTCSELIRSLQLHARNSSRALEVSATVMLWESTANLPVTQLWHTALSHPYLPEPTVLKSRQSPPLTQPLRFSFLTWMWEFGWCCPVPRQICLKSLPRFVITFFCLSPLCMCTKQKLCDNVKKYIILSADRHWLKLLCCMGTEISPHAHPSSQESFPSLLIDVSQHLVNIYHRYFMIYLRWYTCYLHCHGNVT